ncbi:protein of unknown function [Ralstonia solanacearum CMR15]|nr:protein of unknown function [Ralstonia solanacearum CMR15]
MTSRDGRIIAMENEVRVLRALHRFGWLRTRDLAVAVWQQWQSRPVGEPDLQPLVAAASGLRMAQRTLRRLAAARQVLRGQAPDGSVIYALSEAGARRLQQAGVPAASGKDLIRSFSTAQFRHRSIANEIAIGGIIEGFRVSTEREIAQDRWLGGVDGIAGKKPDVLLRADKRIFWVEVERSRRNARDYKKLLAWLRLVADDAAGESKLLGNGLVWAAVVFVCTPAFMARLRRDLLAAGCKRSALDTLVRFETKLYRFEDIAFS